MALGDFLNSLGGNVSKGLGGITGTGLGGTIGTGLGGFAFGPFGASVGKALGSGIGNILGSTLGGNLWGEKPSQTQSNYNDYDYDDEPSYTPSYSKGNTKFLKKIQKAQLGLLNQLQQRPQFQDVNIDPILQQTRQQYEQEILPSIANRFSSGGLQNSSAFRNALTSSGVDLAQKLAALRSQNEQNNAARRMGYENLYQNRLGALSGLIGQQNQLGFNQQQLAQQGGQFNRQFKRDEWDPIYKGISTIGVPLLSAWSGIKQGQNDLTQQKANAERQAANVGLGQQAYPVQHNDLPGALDSAPQVIKDLLLIFSKIRAMGGL